MRTVKGIRANNGAGIHILGNPSAAFFTGQPFGFRLVLKLGKKIIVKSILWYATCSVAIKISNNKFGLVRGKSLKNFSRQTKAIRTADPNIGYEPFFQVFIFLFKRFL